MNKNQRFVCEVLWGGVPTDTDQALESRFFQDKLKEFEDYDNGKGNGSWFARNTKSNRSKSQTLFLLDLVDGSYQSLWDLEMLLRYNHVHYCPGDKEEVSKVFKLGHKFTGKW